MWNPSKQEKFSREVPGLAKGSPVTLVGLDVGTSKTAVIIAEAGVNSPKLIGAAISPSVGLQRGVITDLDAAAKSIGQALERAEKMAGVKVSSAIVSYNGASTTVRSCRVAYTADNPVVSRGRSGAVPVSSEWTPTGIPQGEKVLQLILPRMIPGRFGVVPESDARAITARSRDIANITESARLAGLAVQDIVYGPLAGAAVLLSPVERELGTILVDIGAGTTSISIFDRGLIRETAVLTVGGEHLVGDLAIGLRTSLAHAEEVLKHYSSRPEAGESGEEFALSFEPEGEDAIKVSGDLVRSIIEARITEVLELVAVVIRGFNYPGLLPGGVVLYGGVSRLSGLVHMAESGLRIPVRIGSVETTGMAPDPSYDNALGLIKHTFSCLCGKGPNANHCRLQNDGFTNRFKNWFQDRLKIGSLP